VGDLLSGAMVAMMLVPVAVAVLVPSVVRLTLGRGGGATRTIAAVGVVAAALFVFLFAMSWNQAHAVAGTWESGGAYLVVCGGIALISLGLAMWLLIPDRAEGLSFLGVLLVVIAVVSAFAAGVFMKVPVGGNVVDQLALPLKEGRDGFILAGGPAVLGAVTLFWASLLMYRKSAFSYYYD
jgi:hypothetical protein